MLEINVTEIIIAAIGIIFTGVIIPLGRAAYTWLRGKIKDERVAAALDEAFKIAEQSVRALKQTVVDDLKAKAADGKLTPTEAGDAFKIASQKFLDNLSQRAKDTITANVENIDEFIADAIHAALDKAKQKGTVAIATTAEVCEPGEGETAAE